MILKCSVHFKLTSTTKNYSVIHVVNTYLFWIKYYSAFYVSIQELENCISCDKSSLSAYFYKYSFIGSQHYILTFILHIVGLTGQWRSWLGVATDILLPMNSWKFEKLWFSSPIKRHAKKKKKKAVWGGLTNSCAKKGSEKHRRKGKIYHISAEFQRLARRDKKAFLSDQCKEIEGKIE